MRDLLVNTGAVRVALLTLSRLSYWRLPGCADVPDALPLAAWACGPVTVGCVDNMIPWWT